MPPRKAAPANPGPVAAPPSPGIEAIPSTVDRYPSPPTSSGLILNPTEPLNEDLPGPSSIFIPQVSSPPLPELRSRTFPPDDESDSSDDEILAQLPIYLSPSLHPNLHLFQYPLNHSSLRVPTWARDRGKGISARVKEGVGRVEVEVPVDGDTDVWRDARARDLGFVTDMSRLNGDGEGGVEGGYGFGGRGLEKEKEKEKEKKKKKRKEEKWGDKLRLRSETVPSATGYYSGIIHDGALHLHPVTKLLQMRTSMSYLDDHDTRLRECAVSRREANGDGGGGEGEDKRPKPAGGAAGPGRPPKVREDEDNDGSGSIADFRNKMFWSNQREEEDKWVGYEWKDGNDPIVLQQMETLLVPEEKRVRLECRTRGLDYLNKP